MEKPKINKGIPIIAPTIVRVIKKPAIKSPKPRKIPISLPVNLKKNMLNLHIIKKGKNNNLNILTPPNLLPI